MEKFVRHAHSYHAYHGIDNLQISTSRGRVVGGRLQYNYQLAIQPAGGKNIWRPKNPSTITRTIRTHTNNGKKMQNAAKQNKLKEVCGRESCLQMTGRKPSREREKYDISCICTTQAWCLVNEKKTSRLYHFTLPTRSKYYF